MLALSQANIVILARKFNPTIVSKDWLADKEILTGPVGQFVHTEVLSMVDGEELNIVLDEGRLQVGLKASPSIDLLTSSVRRFIEQLPETPYRAIGINFTFTVDEASLARSPLFQPDPTRMEALFGPEYRLGARVAFSFDGFAAKLELPPAVQQERLAEASFNFHSNVAGADDILERLAQHSSVFSKAESIMKGIVQNGG
jgi:hypothetical protein